MLRHVPLLLVAAGVIAGLVLVVRPLLPPAVAEGDAPPRPEGDVFDPREQPIELPDGYRPTLGRDVIRPIYDPRFVSAGAAGWSDATLVLGVTIDGAAKAYPINVLNSREMVIDRLRGMPLLVSW